MAKQMAAMGTQIMALGAQLAGGKATGLQPGGLIGGVPPGPPPLQPPPHRRSRRGRRRRSDSRRSRRRDQSRRRGRRSRSGCSGRIRQSSSYSSYSVDDQDDGGSEAFSGWFWQGHALPRNCSRYGKMPPPIVYEIAHILLPKKFTVASISGHPDFHKNAHRDVVLQAIFKLTGQGASNRIPSIMRKQPELFFQSFEQLRARAAKVFKEDPTLGMPAVAATDAAIAKASGEAVPADSGAAVAKAGGDAVAQDLVAKAVLSRTS